MARYIVAVVAVLLMPVRVVTQSPFVHEGSIGEVKKEKPVEGLSTIEIKDWMGQRFILLPASPKLRGYGYQLFEPQLPYQGWVGKTLTVSDVSTDYLPKVTFRTEDGKIIRSTAYGDVIEGIAPLRDLEYARSRWLGKTLWIRGNELVTWNAQTDEFGSVKLKKYSPVEVQDVVAGWYGHQPIRLILKTSDGQLGFYDVSVSGTNVSLILREHGHFEDAFFETDPHDTYKWSKEVWDAIESGKVFIGMTTEQVQMSWGKPKAVNRTTTTRGTEEQWVYGDSNYLYVSNGRVTAIQN